MKNFIIICLLVLLTSCQLAQREHPHEGKNIPKEFLGWWTAYSRAAADQVLQVRPDGRIMWYDQENGDPAPAIPEQKYYFLSEEDNEQESVIYLIAQNLIPDSNTYDIFQLYRYQVKDSGLTLIIKELSCDDYNLNNNDWQSLEPKEIIAIFKRTEKKANCHTRSSLKYVRSDKHEKDPFSDFISRDSKTTISGDVYKALEK